MSKARDIADLDTAELAGGAGSGLDADKLDGQQGAYYTAYADTAISNLVDSSPASLNTLNELAAALGDDVNFSTTVTDSIALKAPLASPTFTGTVVATSLDISGNIDVDGTTNLDVVDIDGAVDMASTALVTGVLTTTAGTVFNGGFASNTGSTITTANNLPQLSLISTDADANAGPVLKLFRNSSSPADGDVTGYMQFFGENDAGEETLFVDMYALSSDVSNGSEESAFYLRSMVGGTLSQRISLLPSAIVINEDSLDADFRVESNGNTHMLFVDGGTNRVHIGTTSGSGGNLVVASNSSANGIQILARTNDDYGFLNWYNAAGSSQWGAIAGIASGLLHFDNAGAERMRVTSAGVIVNEGGNDTDFRVESDGNANMLFVDGGNNRVGIGGTPGNMLDVHGTATFRTGGSTPDATVSTYGKGIEITGGNMRLNIDVSNVSNGGSYLQTRHIASAYPAAYYDLKLNPLGGFVTVNDADHSNGGLFVKGGIAFDTNNDAHRMDSYEQGTWTPTVSSGTLSPNYATYTKIGRVVHVQVEIQLTGSRTSAAFRVNGLPFTNAQWTAASAYAAVYNSEGTEQLSGAIQNNSTSLAFISFGAEAVGTDFGNGYLNVNATYYV